MDEKTKQLLQDLLQLNGEASIIMTDLVMLHAIVRDEVAQKNACVAIAQRIINMDASRRRMTDQLLTP